MAVVLGLDRAAGNRGIAPLGDPAFADRWQAGGEVDARNGVGVGARGVIDADRRLQRIDQTSFSTSSSIDEVTAELPILALILTRKFRPMIVGSSSG